MMSIEKITHTETIAMPSNDFMQYALSHGFGDLHFKADPATGMQAIIAVHNTKLGPALGGCRFIEYDDLFSAIHDAMRLARGMSYKAALTNLPLGGGKSVIIKPKGGFDRASYFHTFGKFVNELNGRYITALDSGTELTDMANIASQTSYVASRPEHGDPSPSTALGVFRGVQAAASFKFGNDNLSGRHVAIQGLGHVGYNLARHLHEAGAKLTVSDINNATVERAVKEFGATAVTVDAIHKTDCDIFSPCALGAIINDLTINQIQAQVIAGAANNQLAHTYHGKLLHEKGILYAPDYVINAGGLVFAASKYLNMPEDQLLQKVNGIAESLLEIFQRSSDEDLPTSEIADCLAQEKIA
ncbi:Leu/Phe/Val dehydrogenase [Legionella dresdenensis]|uniref:Leu/Phe/Val dehydrogenase n=1 Tax=Legionella dresdenensis TaxID=450200 RepID=A0ABV8CCT5_9GAMM